MDDTPSTAPLADSASPDATSAGAAEKSKSQLLAEKILRLLESGGVNAIPAMLPRLRGDQALLVRDLRQMGVDLSGPMGALVSPPGAFAARLLRREIGPGRNPNEQALVDVLCMLSDELLVRTAEEFRQLGAELGPTLKRGVPGDLGRCLAALLKSVSMNRRRLTVGTRDVSPRWWGNAEDAEDVLTVADQASARRLALAHARETGRSLAGSLRELAVDSNAAEALAALATLPETYAVRRLQEAFAERDEDALTRIIVVHRDQRTLDGVWRAFLAATDRTLEKALADARTEWYGRKDGGDGDDYGDGSALTGDPLVLDMLRAIVVETAK